MAQKLKYIYYLKPDMSKLRESISMLSGLDDMVRKKSEVEKVAILPFKSEARVYIKLPKIIQKSDIDSIKQLLTKRFPMDYNVDFKVKYEKVELSEYLKTHFNDLLIEVSHRLKKLKSIVSIARYEIKSLDKVSVFLMSDFAVKEAKKDKLDEILQRKIRKYTGHTVKIAIEKGDFSNELLNITSEIVREQKQIMTYMSRLEKEVNAVVFGSMSNAKKVKISEIDTPGKRVKISGECVHYFSRKVSNSAILNEMILFDGESSIFVKFFEEKDRKLRGEIKENKFYTVTGVVKQDLRMQEIQIQASGIMLEPDRASAVQDEAPRAELHLHTKYSSMDSIVDIKELISQCVKYNIKYIAVTDHGVVHAFPELYKAAKAKNIKPILGSELYIIPGEDKKAPAAHVTALVKNQTGLKNLYKLVSTAHLKYFRRTPKCPKEYLDSHREGLLLGSACAKGELYSAILDKKSEDELLKIARYYDFIEIMPVANNDFLIRTGKYSEKDLQEINNRILEIGKKAGVPVVATEDVHYLFRQNNEVRNILQVGIGFKDVMKKPALYLRPASELLKEFSYLGEDAAKEVVLDNPIKIAEMTEDVKPIPDGFYPPVIEGAEEQFLNRVYSKARALYGDDIPEFIKDRMEYELKSITGNKFSVLYFMAMQLVDYVREKGGIVGSRGSVGSSFVAMLADITEVNPLPAHYRCPSCKYVEFSKDADTGPDLPPKKCPKCGAELLRDGFNIPFEVFLGFKGDKVPDIDLNFSEQFQMRVHNYTKKIYGEKNVFRAGTYNTLQERNALGYIRKFMEETGADFSRADMIRLSKKIVGVKKTTGQHAGGLIVLPNNMEIYDFCPIQYAANKSVDGTIITHFEYHSMEAQLVKLDLLGQDSPTMLEFLAELTGIAAEQVPLDDPGTLELFSTQKPLGLTAKALGTDLGVLGIPEFGTDFVQGILKMVRPKTFDELVRISGLSHGTNVWMGNAEALMKKSVASSLKDLICARDDVMLYLIDRGVDKADAFKIMETVRKKNKFLNDEQVSNMKQHNIPDWLIDSCQKIEYLFPKAHAVAYTIMSFRIAYFKLHHPLEYYSAYFTIKRDDFDVDLAMLDVNEIEREIKKFNNLPNNGKTKKDKDKYSLLSIVKEMRLRGFSFSTVSVYKSQAFRFMPLQQEQKVLLPLNIVPGLGAKAAVSVVEARKNGPFKSWDELRERTGVNKTTLQVLNRIGALEGIPENVQTFLF